MVDALKAPSQWECTGATAYTGAVKDQPTAATKVGTSADKVAGALMFSAIAGLAFYVALGVIIAQSSSPLQGLSQRSARSSSHGPGSANAATRTASQPSR